MSGAVHPLYAAMGTTVFDAMSALARDLGAINLGQGYPEGEDPPELIEAAVRGLRERSNQYPPMFGIAELRDAVCAFYDRRQGLALTREQVVVTSGATEAIAACMLGLVSPGDEVILFQPAYDAYAPMVRRAGGVPVAVMLRPPDWSYLRDEIEAAITPRTTMLVLNDPHNPVGKAASSDELAMLAEICVAHDLTALCDEVWEEVRFDDIAHRALMSFPGMAERTVKIGSAGKIFGLTGWKTGWFCADTALAGPLARVHQFLTYTTPPHLQWALAEGLTYSDDWFAARDAAWTAARARLNRGLEQGGYVVLPNAATWFLCVDLAASGIALTDREFAERAIREAGVAAIPISALGEGEVPTHIVRFCFTKEAAVLEEAIERLATFRATLSDRP